MIDPKDVKCYIDDVEVECNTFKEDYSNDFINTI